MFADARPLPRKRARQDGDDAATLLQHPGLITPRIISDRLGGPMRS
jgi:hypothetical protein